MEEKLYKNLSVSVDTSIRLEDPVYYFRFKGVAIKYSVSQKTYDTDCVTISYLMQKYSSDSAYKLLTEFLSLWAFETDEIVMPRHSIEGGPIFSDEKKALEANITVCDTVSVPKMTSASTIIYLPKIENDIQDKTVRLYRMARSHNDVYSQALFFWHTIIYPSEKEEDAEKYIQDFIDKNISECKHVYELIDSILKFRIYGKKIDKCKFGNHVRQDIRHAIAHIVRANNGGRIEIDNRAQQNYIAGISRILRFISRYKIENDHGLSLEKPHGVDYFASIPLV